MSDIHYRSQDGLDSSIDTLKLKASLLKQNLADGEMYYGEQKVRTSQFLGEATTPYCGFCTAKDLK